MDLTIIRLWFEIYNHIMVKHMPKSSLVMSEEYNGHGYESYLNKYILMMKKLRQPIHTNFKLKRKKHKSVGKEKQLWRHFRWK